jgi:hypothetical protein
MIFDFDDFVTVPKHASHEFGKVLRLNRSSFIIGKAVAQLYADEKDTSRIMVTVKYSDKYKALQLTKTDDEKEGFIFSRNEKGDFVRNGKPSGFKEMRIPIGIYAIPSTSSSTDIFVLQNDEDGRNSALRKYFIESPASVTIDSIVSWGYYTRNHQAFFATGQVRDIYDKEVKGKTEKWASIRPISKVFCDTYPTKKIVNVQLNQVIFREKL